MHRVDEPWDVGVRMRQPWPSFGHATAETNLDPAIAHGLGEILRRFPGFSMPSRNTSLLRCRSNHYYSGHDRKRPR
jgi:hypothetical protein